MGTKVTGTVLWFNEDKGFGKASARLDGPGMTEVFFHVDGGRIVTGTADEPVLTLDKPERPLWVTVRPRPSELIMNVVTGAKGPRAATWGIVPRRCWRTDLANSRRLDEYVGGELSIDGVSYLLRSVTLTTERLSVTRILAKVDWSAPGPGMTYVPAPGAEEETVCYDMEQVSPEKSLPHGRYGLRVSKARGRDTRLTFYPPHKR